MRVMTIALTLLFSVPSHIRYPPHAGMFLEQHFLRTYKINAAHLNNCNFIEVDWLAREHDTHYGLCKSTAAFESFISQTPHEAVAFIQMDDHPSTQGWKFPTSWTVVSAGGFSADHIDVPLVTEAPSLARRMLRVLQQQLADGSDSMSHQLRRRPLDMFYLGRNTHVTRRLSSMQWSVLGPFPRSVHVDVQQPISVEATVTHHALLQSSKYAFAPRGNGGSSFRICEAIAAGSVPVYIWNNTVEEGPVIPRLSRPFSEFALFFSSRFLPLLSCAFDCISDGHFHSLLETGRSVAREFTVSGVMQRVFSALSARAMPRKLLPRSDGLLDIAQRALEDAVRRHDQVHLCSRSDIRISISLAYVLCVSSLEQTLDCEHALDLEQTSDFDREPVQEHSCRNGPSRRQLNDLHHKLQSSFLDAGYSALELNAFSFANGEVNYTASFCDVLMILLRPLLQCSIPTAELLSRASFVLRTCRAPLPTWAALVRRAGQLCGSEPQGSVFERGDEVFECSASTAVRVASENLALKLELFKQQTSASKVRRKGMQHGKSAHLFSKKCTPQTCLTFCSSHNGGSCQCAAFAGVQRRPPSAWHRPCRSADEGLLLGSRDACDDDDLCSFYRTG
jgi:hypothetical protein